MLGIFLTDCGRVRSHNEDAGGIFYNRASQALAVIADGMGGHQAGDVASQMAVTYFQDKWEKTNEFSSPNEIEQWLTKSLEEINTSIYMHAQSNNKLEGMGTTIVIAAFFDDFLTIAHIGDSRCYMLNNNGFRQVTEDHSLVNALVQSGQLSKDDAAIHPRKNVVLRALGTETSVEVDVQTLTVENNDKILLCSDGLTDKITDKELAELINSDKNIKIIGEKLIDLANSRGGEDNISLIIMHNDAPEEVGEDVERESPTE